MEQISLWKNKQIVSKRFRSLKRLNAYIKRKKITEFYHQGYYCIIV